jgi:hypothetical protein
MCFSLGVKLWVCGVLTRVALPRRDHTTVRCDAGEGEGGARRGWTLAVGLSGNPNPGLPSYHCGCPSVRSWKIVPK